MSGSHPYLPEQGNRRPTISRDGRDDRKRKTKKKSGFFGCTSPQTQIIYESAPNPTTSQVPTVVSAHTSKEQSLKSSLRKSNNEILEGRRYSYEHTNRLKQEQRANYVQTQKLLPVMNDKSSNNATFSKSAEIMEEISHQSNFDSKDIIKKRVLSQDIWDDYEQVNSVSRGPIGEVSLARQKGSGTDSKYYVVKTIHLGKISPHGIEELRKEMTSLVGLNHPNIVTSYKVYENNNQLCLLMDACDGMDFSSRGPFTEREVSSIVRDVMSAVSYMHSNGFHHLDLKVENIIFIDAEDKVIPMILGFGLSKKFMKLDEMVGEICTYYNVAPEALEGTYANKSDMWSVGVLTYTLLSATRPFQATDAHIFIKAIRMGEFNFDGKPWDEISEDAKDFISSLLIVDINLRLSAKQSLAHKWLAHQKTKPINKKSAMAAPMMRADGIDKDVATETVTFTQVDGLDTDANMTSMISTPDAGIDKDVTTMTLTSTQGDGIDKDATSKSVISTSDNGLDKDITITTATSKPGDVMEKDASITSMTSTQYGVDKDATTMTVSSMQDDVLGKDATTVTVSSTQDDGIDKDATTMTVGSTQNYGIDKDAKIKRMEVELNEVRRLLRLSVNRMDEKNGSDNDADSAWTETSCFTATEYEKKIEALKSIIFNSSVGSCDSSKVGYDLSSTNYADQSVNSVEEDLSARKKICALNDIVASKEKEVLSLKSKMQEYESQIEELKNQHAPDATIESKYSVRIELLKAENQLLKMRTLKSAGHSKSLKEEKLKLKLQMKQLETFTKSLQSENAHLKTLSMWSE